MLAYDPELAVASLMKADKKLAKVVQRAGEFTMRPKRLQSVFHALFQAIVYQQLSGKAAGTILSRVLALYEEVQQALVLPAPAERRPLVAAAVADYFRELLSPFEMSFRGYQESNRELQRRSEELGAKGGGYGHTARIPLKGLSPGRYVLRTEARSLLASRPTVSRELEFRVR